MTDIADIPVFILCGGQGTRLREETEFRPKPMVDIGQRPILWHLMKIYSHFGVRNFVLCLGYKAEVIKEYFLNYKFHTGSLKVDLRSGVTEHLGAADGIEDWNVHLVDTGLESMTGLRIQKALEAVPAERFFLTYGDGVANIDLKALLTQHEEAGRKATITAVHPSSRFGELSLDGDLVQSFTEKPQTAQGWINGGFMVMEQSAMDVLPQGANEPLETAVLETLSHQHDLSVYRHDGFWQCMDTFRETQLLNSLWASGDAPWRFWSE
jgi:glucose-1-phosphate cytidylyltransferase